MTRSRRVEKESSGQKRTPHQAWERAEPVVDMEEKAMKALSIIKNLSAEQYATVSKVMEE